jgi:hypothetical protein
MPATTKKILGEKFGLLTPYKEATSPTTDKGRATFWVCRCACGNVAKVRQDRLLSGKTRSCGCLKDAHRRHLQEMAFERAILAEPQPQRRTAPPKHVPKHVTAKQIESYKKVYGLEPDEWARLVAKQSGCCAICGANMDDTPLFVDHDHATGAVRGLLCRKCNSGLGMLDDSLRNLGAAINYLANPPASST